MTLIAEIYSNGFGVKQDDAKAAEWYKRATDMGDPEAMFGLAMLKISGRGGAQDRDGGALRGWRSASQRTAKRASEPRAWRH